MQKILLALGSLCVSLSTWAFGLTDLTAQLQKPHTVQRQFKQQRFLKSIQQPMQTSGQFALHQQKGLFWHTQKPLELRLRLRADGIAQWDNQSQRWHTSNQSQQSNQVKLFMAVLSGNTQELQKQFDITLTGKPQQWQLTLLPKTAVMKQIFQHITIQGDQLVRRVELHEKQGERTIMQFNALKTNQAFNALAQHALP